MIQQVQLSRADIRRCMQCVARKGYNPYDSHASYERQAARALADKARRLKDLTSEYLASKALSAAVDQYFRASLR